MYLTLRPANGHPRDHRRSSDAVAELVMPPETARRQGSDSLTLSRQKPAQTKLRKDRAHERSRRVCFVRLSLCPLVLFVDLDQSPRPLARPASSPLPIAWANWANWLCLPIWSRRKRGPILPLVSCGSLEDLDSATAWTGQGLLVKCMRRLCKAGKDWSPGRAPWTQVVFLDVGGARHRITQMSIIDPPTRCKALATSLDSATPPRRRLVHWVGIQVR